MAKQFQDIFVTPACRQLRRRESTAAASPRGSGPGSTQAGTDSCARRARSPRSTRLVASDAVPLAGSAQPSEPPGTVAADPSHPCVYPNWDNTPRSGLRGVILHGPTPALFRRHLQETIGAVAARAPERRLVFVKSWNEWAEGNYLEPDQRFGHEYLKAVREVVVRQ